MKKYAALLLVILLLVTLGACTRREEQSAEQRTDAAAGEARQETREGAAATEQAGREAGREAEKTGEGIGQKAEQLGREAKQEAKELGREASAAVGGAREGVEKEKAAEGASVYKANCATCHGADAAGKTAMKAPALKGTDEAAIRKVIADHPQHARFKKLTDDQIKAVSDYLRSL